MYVAALEDLARHQDAWTATFAAKRLEIRTPLRFERHPWAMRVVLVPLFIGCGTLAFLCWLKRAMQKRIRAASSSRNPMYLVLLILLGRAAFPSNAGLRLQSCFPRPLR